MQVSAIASAGITAAVGRFEASAVRTAQAPLDDLAGQMVERLQASSEVKANVAVLRSANDMMGDLLDILA